MGKRLFKLLKKNLQLYQRLVLSQGRLNKSWVPMYSPTHEELKNLCLIALGQCNGELW